MRFRMLGQSGVQVSVAGLGGSQLGSVVDSRGTQAIIDRALELGVNFVDTSETYGSGASEEAIGKALVGRRDEVVLATKTGAPQQGVAGRRLTRERMIARLEASLQRLGTHYVDIYYFHFPDPLTPLEESLLAVQDLIRAGKVRFGAISNHSAWQVADAVGICERRDFDRPIASQVQYNLLDRSAEAEMIPTCTQFGISLVPYLPLAGGFLTGKYRRNVPHPTGTRLTRADPGRQANLRANFTERNFDELERWEAFASSRGRLVGELAVSWLLAHPIVCSVITGATSTEQVDANVRATEWELSIDEVAGL